MNEAEKPDREWHDPIVDEVRSVREKLFAECDFDLEKLTQLLRKEQAESGHRIVTRSPRPVKDKKVEAS